MVPPVPTPASVITLVQRLASPPQMQAARDCGMKDILCLLAPGRAATAALLLTASAQQTALHCNHTECNFKRAQASMCWQPPATRMSTVPAVSRQISGPVVA